MAGPTKTIHSDRILSDLLWDRVLPDLLEQQGLGTPQENSRIDVVPKFQFNESDIRVFSNLLIANDVESAHKAVDDLIVDGCSASALIMDILSASARYLGERWCSDESSFADVTIGMAALHEVLRYLDKPLGRELQPTGEERSILFVTMPGDTHIFGTSVLESYFRNSGWNVETEYEVTAKGLTDLVANQIFDVVGFSVAHSEAISHCKSLTAIVRRNSVNERIKVMAGGSAFLRNGKLQKATGVDAVADSALSALQVASRICAMTKFDKETVDHV